MGGQYVSCNGFLIKVPEGYDPIKIREAFRGGVRPEDAQKAGAPAPVVAVKAETSSAPEPVEPPKKRGRPAGSGRKQRGG